jgi:hypothetical protein
MSMELSGCVGLGPSENGTNGSSNGSTRSEMVDGAPTSVGVVGGTGGPYIPDGGKIRGSDSTEGTKRRFTVIGPVAVESGAGSERTACFEVMMSDDDPPMDDMRTRTAETKYAIEFAGGPHDGLVTYWRTMPSEVIHADWRRPDDPKGLPSRYVMTRKLNCEGRLVYEFREPGWR